MGGPVSGEAAPVLPGEPRAERLAAGGRSLRALIWLAAEKPSLKREYSSLWTGWTRFYPPTTGYSWGETRQGIARRRAPPRAHKSRARRLSSRPCQDDSHSLCEWGPACLESDTTTLILCADEVWRERRSESCILRFHADRDVASWSSRSIGEEAVLRRRRR